MFKKVDFGPGLAPGNPMRPSIEKVLPILEEEIGQPAERVRVSWELCLENPSRPLLKLTIADWDVEVIGIFSAEELENPNNQLRHRFVHMWGNLLQEASHRRLQRIREYQAQTVDA
jgi:hypothetical protein